MSRKLPKEPATEKLEAFYDNLRGDIRTFFDSFVRLGVPKNLAFDFAFDLSELKSEIVGIGGLLCKICDTKRCSPREFDALMATVASHWVGHVQDLNQAWHQLPWIELTTPSRRRRKPQNRSGIKNAKRKDH